MRGKWAVAVVLARPFLPQGGLIAQGAGRRRPCAPRNNGDGSAAPCVFVCYERKAPSAAGPALQETGAVCFQGRRAPAAPIRRCAQSSSGRRCWREKTTEKLSCLSEPTSSTKTLRNACLRARLPHIFPENTLISRCRSNLLLARSPESWAQSSTRRQEATAWRGDGGAVPRAIRENARRLRLLSRPRSDAARRRR